MWAKIKHKGFKAQFYHLWDPLSSRADCAGQPIRYLSKCGLLKDAKDLELLENPPTALRCTRCHRSEAK